MTWQQLVGICVGTAAILACLYGLAKLTRDLMSGMRRLGRMLDDWLGEPEHPGYPGTGRPGVIARLASVEEKLQVVSLLERRVAEVETQVKFMAEHAPADGLTAIGSQNERATDAADVRQAYGFIEQRSR